MKRDAERGATRELGVGRVVRTAPEGIESTSTSPSTASTPTPFVGLLAPSSSIFSSANPSTRRPAAVRQRSIRSPRRCRTPR